ncbi:MAG: RagB/SusD family nutrient uptake outer membrane protein [Bacteroidales bacterium]|nr:RagB/SusD family nutrient uptake outer membrane protein [Bacteroidales bacterium]
MKRITKYSFWWITLGLSILFMTSCEKFLNPEQELRIVEDNLYKDWYEYRSVEMGMYALQQKLVEQLLVLGELRGDLLEITPNASADMVEVYNFNISKANAFASPTGFFKLIAACNNFIRILETEKPYVLDPDSPVNNYDKLYGEVLCMRAWAYFNAVRIYGKVPYIHESLTTIGEIEAYLESPGTYIDSVHVNFARDGYYNDTVFNEPIELEKQYYDTDLVVDTYTNQLKNRVKAVGVNHFIENNDDTWEVTIWNDYAMDALMGQMYLTQGDLVQASTHFLRIMNNPSDTYRYHIDNSFSYSAWRRIFALIDNREHIYTIWFNKSNFQQNAFQSYFEDWGPHQFKLRPTYQAVLKWESVFRNAVINEDQNNPDKSEVIFPGIPSDFYRGFGSSYLYVRNSVSISGNEYMDMLMLRRDGDDRSSRAIMENMDTVVIKYSVGRNSFGQDANYTIYRAAGIHLYMAEIYTYWVYIQNDLPITNTNAALGILNDGSNYTLDAGRPEMGIRGRVGLGGGNDVVSVRNINYTHDPFTNEITGYIDLTGNFLGKQEYLEELVMEEKARELAFEGERFYDLMRVAKRRNDPSYLAEKVASKFPADKRDQIYNHLLDENNWYINYFE